MKTFPHVLSFPGFLLGSREPVEFDPAANAARAADPCVRDHYQRAGIDIEALMQVYIDTPPVRFWPEFDRTRLVDVNTDLFPKDEFDLAAP